MAKAYEYEVRCGRCNVSFPKGTKKCLHCGGPTGPSHGPGSSMRPGRLEALFDPREPEKGTHADDGFLRPSAVDEEPEQEVGRAGGLLRGAITVVWILLAIGFSIARACSESK